MVIGKGLNWVSIIKFTDFIEIAIHLVLFKKYIWKIYKIKL